MSEGLFSKLEHKLIEFSRNKPISRRKFVSRAAQTGATLSLLGYLFRGKAYAQTNDYYVQIASGSLTEELESLINSLRPETEDPRKPSVYTRKDEKGIEYYLGPYPERKVHTQALLLKNKLKGKIPPIKKIKKKFLELFRTTLYDLQYGAFEIEDNATKHFETICDFFPDEEIHLIQHEGQYKIIKNLKTDIKSAKNLAKVGRNQIIDTLGREFKLDVIAKESYDLNKVEVLEQHSPTVLDLKSLGDGHYIQFGSFGDKNNADILFNHLKNIKIKGPFLSPTQIKGETYYRVLSGPYKSVDEAEKASTSAFQSNQYICTKIKEVAIVQPSEKRPGRFEWLMPVINNESCPISKESLKKKTKKENIYDLVSNLTNKYNLQFKNKENHIDADIIRALIWGESRYEKYAVSFELYWNKKHQKFFYKKDESGNRKPCAYGYTQLIKSTAKDELDINLKDIFDTKTNIWGGIRYFGKNIFKHQNKHGNFETEDEKYRYGLACYNGGPTHVSEAMELARSENKGKIITFEHYNKHLKMETQKYVKKVMDQYYALKNGNASKLHNKKAA